MIAEFIAPDALHDWWDFIRPGCEAVQRRARANWRVEDVYAELQGGQAQLAVIKNDTQHALGFVVLKRIVEKRGPTLFVWVIHGRLATVERDLYDWLGTLRAQAGCKAVWWMSPRRWDARPRVRLVQHVYELE